MPKGNRKPKETKHFDYALKSAVRKEIFEAAKKSALAQRERSPYSPEKQGVFIERLQNYIDEQEKKGDPLTVSGFNLASKIPSATWDKMRRGEYDAGIEEYKMLKGIPMDATEWTTEDGEVLSLRPWSEIVDYCYLLAQQQRETACIKGKAGNVIGNIFLLKSQHGLSDQPEQVAHQTNIQVVADAETALKALEMCK